ncbi:MAG: hypothetical protein Q9183_005520, partial [Haloplaca sp. 2 TL-2023]
MAPTPDGHNPNIAHAVKHTGQRLKHFVKPNGRQVHVAASPEEHARLQKNLSAVHPNDAFDIFIHGSPEHLDTVREIHAHHAEKRESLREKHAGLYDEFEHVYVQVEAMSQELQHLTEHLVSLDANFSKFGYDAHLRTLDPDSSASSIDRRSSDHGPRDWDAERRQGRSLKVWKRPSVRQYLHKGLLWRSSHHQEVASFELFVDAFYVGIVAVIGDAAAEEPTGYGLLKFIIVFTIGWKIWGDLQMVTTWL